MPSHTDQFFSAINFLMDHFPIRMIRLIYIFLCSEKGVFLDPKGSLVFRMFVIISNFEVKGGNYHLEIDICYCLVPIMLQIS